jgi:hypothetical protein
MSLSRPESELVGMQMVGTRLATGAGLHEAEKSWIA